MRRSHIITLLLFVFVLAIGCVRKTKIVDPVPAPVAGIGGHDTLWITPAYRGRNIDSCMIWIKYNAYEAPSSTVKYDDSSWMATKNGKPVAEFDSLKQGNYYFRAIGWDANIADTVLGGATFKIVDTFAKKYELYLEVFPKH